MSAAMRTRAMACCACAMLLSIGLQPGIGVAAKNADKTPEAKPLWQTISIGGLSRAFLP